MASKKKTILSHPLTPWAAGAAGVILVGTLAFQAGRTRQGGEIVTFGSPSARTGMPGLSEARTLAAEGDRLFESGKYAQAVPLYERALALDGSDADTHNDLGLSLHYTGRSEEAVKHLVQATELAPDFSNAWLSLGFVLDSLGRKEEAKPALRHVVKLVPGTPQAAEAARLLGDRR